MSARGGDTERGRRGERRAAASPVYLLGAIALCVLPIFAHGCHRGDHDDEPTVMPVAEQRVNQPSSD
jgi:hypothetical protein